MMLLEHILVWFLYCISCLC